MAIQIPNLQIKKILEGLITVVKNNHTSKVDQSLETESWLYRQFNGVIYGEWDFYEQVIELLINRGVNSPRRLDIRIGFPSQKPTNPTIFITNPSERQNGINAIGFGEDMGQFYKNADDSIDNISNRGNEASYEIIITSNNAFETELIYRLIQALFIANYQTINDIFNGTFDFSGKELMPNFELMPNMYIKTFAIRLQYTQEVSSMYTVEYLNDVQFELQELLNN